MINIGIVNLYLFLQAVLRHGGKHPFSQGRRGTSATGRESTEFTIVAKNRFVPFVHL